MSFASAITSPRFIPNRNSIPPVGGSVALDHPPLDLDSAPDGVHHARELGEEPVASVLYNAPAVLGDLGVDQLPEVRGEALVTALFVSTHKARVPRHVGGEDRGKAADRGMA